MVQSKVPVLSIRTELFEHGIYPLKQNKLTSQILITTFTNLNLLSSIDYKIKIHHWLEQAKKHIPSMTEQDAQIYYLTYKALLEDVDSPDKQKDVTYQEMQVDVRCFAIYICLQLFSQQSNAAVAEDSWGVKDQQVVGMSPRQKTNQLNDQKNVIMSFIKSNLKLMLRLVSTDIHNNEVSLTANEFNSLRVVFRINQSSGKSLSSLSNLFQPGAHSAKVHMQDLQDWLLANVEKERKGVEYITFLNKSVTVKDQDIGQSVRILNCEDSYIYISQKIECLEISSCTNCTVFCAAVQRVCSLMKCENVNLTVASGVVRVGNCVDSAVNCYSHLAPPVVFGDTRSLTLGPHNASYPDLKDLLTKANINIQVNDFQQRLNYFSFPQLMHVAKQSVIQQQAFDFMRMALPNNFGQSALFLCPKDPFLDMISLRNQKFEQVQKQIKARNLTGEQEKMLHVAIQGYFREWFVQTNNYKQITDLVRMMDQEF